MLLSSDYKAALLASPPPLRIEAWRQDLYDAITALPRTEMGVAMFMFDRGIVGHPGDGQNCPLSLYLDRLPFVKSMVNSTHIFAQPRAIDLHTTTMENAIAILTSPIPEWPFLMELPRHLWAFVRNFDNGHYPMLITRVPIAVEMVF